MLQITPEIEPFYRSALLALRALEAAGARRPSFGPDPDARWKAFRGELRDADRLDLLIRNAAATTPTAFAPRVVLGLPGLADDEPFGPDWPGPDAALAAALLHGAAQPVTQAPLPDLLAQVVRAWALSPKPVPADQTASIAPQTRIVAAGAGAVLALADRFQAGRGLDLSEQVLLVTANPGERQLLGIAAAVLAASGSPRLLAPLAAGENVEGAPAAEQARTIAERARAAGFSRADLLLVSDDAAPEARAAVEAIARELGA